MTSNGTDEIADVAVVGSGPVGLKLSLALADAGLKVQLVEAGVDGHDAVRQATCDAEIADPQHHAPMSLAVRRAFGGTSHLWGGRAVPFDTVDFAPREWVPGADWPFALGDLAPWYEEACRFLDCGPAEFSDGTFARERVNGLHVERLERWCAQPNLTGVHGARVKAHSNIRVMLGTTVLRIDVDPERGTVRRLVAVRDDGEQPIRARAFAIAAGGLETTRLLLASREENPALFGGPDGSLGRYYMGHLFGSIADITFDREGEDRGFDFKRDASGRYVRRRFTLDRDTQLAHKLLNMSAWPEPAPMDNPQHQSGILSMAYLALATPGLGSLLSPEAIRARKVGHGPVRVWPHLRNVLTDIPGSASFAARFAKQRYFSKVRLPGFFVANAARRYAFHYHAEQAPNASSLVRLSDTRDALGQRRLVIAPRFGESDAESIVRTHTLMDEALRASGLGRLSYGIEEGKRTAAVLEQASDGFHQIGTARMSSDPRRGVVDANARVHGLSNLFLAGSAIFPSSGQANPTLTAVALAARLATRLTDEMRTLPATTQV